MLLNSENPISNEFEFSGVINLLIDGGFGTVTLERRVRGSDFHPVSIDLKNWAVFDCDGGCAYNGFIESKGSGVVFRFNASGIIEGDVSITMSRAV